MVGSLVALKMSCYTSVHDDISEGDQNFLLTKMPSHVIQKTEVVLPNVNYI